MSEYIHPNMQKNIKIHKIYLNIDKEIHVESYPVVYMNSGYVFFKVPGNNYLENCIVGEDNYNSYKSTKEFDKCIDDCISILARDGDGYYSCYTMGDVDLDKLKEANLKINELVRIKKIERLNSNIADLKNKIAYYIREIERLSKDKDELEKETASNEG